MINLSLPTWIPFLLSDKQFDNQTYFPDLMINWRCKTFPTVSWVRARCYQVSLGSSQDSILCQNLSTLLILLQVESHQSFVIFNKILILLTLIFSILPLKFAKCCNFTQKEMLDLDNFYPKKCNFGQFSTDEGEKYGEIFSQFFRWPGKK